MTDECIHYSHSLLYARCKNFMVHKIAVSRASVLTQAYIIYAVYTSQLIS